MNEYWLKYLKVAVAVVVVVACLVLVIVGHRCGTDAGGLGLQGLFMEFGGLAGLLALLGVYNHNYTK